MNIRNSLYFVKKKDKCIERKLPDWGASVLFYLETFVRQSAKALYKTRKGDKDGKVKRIAKKGKIFSIDKAGKVSYSISVAEYKLPWLSR